MQIKGKIFTIIGIVLLFGYFIMDSITPSNPSQVVLIGNDTLGRDWGAMAEQVARSRQQIEAENNVAGGYVVDLSGQNNNPYSHMYGVDSNGAYTATTPASQDPFMQQKLNQDNYSSIESSDGREIITGYARPEEENNRNTPENNAAKIETRHQKEVTEPKMKYRD